MVGYAELAMMLSNEPRIAHYLSEIYTSGKRGQGLRDVAVRIQGQWVRPGDWLAADADGIIVLDRAPP